MTHRTAKLWAQRALTAYVRHFGLVGICGLALHLTLHAVAAIVRQSWIPLRAALVIEGGLALPFLIMILWHEAGHAAAALWRGIRVNGIGLGPLTGGLVILWGRPGLRLYRRGPAWNAYISCRIPLNDRDRLILAAGGPVATAVLGIACLAGAGAYWWSHGHWNLFAEYSSYAWRPDLLVWSKELIVPAVAWTGVVGLLDTAMNLQSIERSGGKGGFRSDGWHIRRILVKHRSFERQTSGRAGINRRDGLGKGSDAPSE